MIAVDETKLKVKGQEAYVWAAIGVETKELLAIDASYQRSSLNAHLFLRKALRKCKNKPIVLVGEFKDVSWIIFIIL